MLPFKKIELQDKELISHITLNSSQRNCDLSFSNLCSWSFLYDTHFALYQESLIIRFRVDEQMVYMPPIGKGDLSDALKVMMEDAHSIGEEFTILGASQETCKEIEKVMPGQFCFSEERNYADYLYLRTDLATLSGKKLQAKRNHVNKFKRTYSNYEYLPLTAKEVKECLDLEATWCAVNHCDQIEGTGNERRALVYALHHFEELGLTGGILRVNGEIAAFTYGMPINQDTFGIHAEKADTRIQGAYAMINQEFARRIPEQYTYLNREEDLGIEGLRHAKLSYQPIALLSKYMICRKDNAINHIHW
ncbi:MAG: DUF2156 domain-containing protein [Mediterranea massiliensis]|nr:DUF2156 domain-containing protein [Mediterranea massiliensis]